MSLLEKVCEELGVKFDEEWLANDGHTYKITSDGRLFVKDSTWIDIDDWANIISGELKPVWKPKIGEAYYVPSLSTDEDCRYEWYFWDENGYDKWYLENNLAFKTIDGAIDMANKMLKVAREAEQDETSGKDM